MKRPCQVLQCLESTKITKPSPGPCVAMDSRNKNCPPKLPLCECILKLHPYSTLLLRLAQSASLISYIQQTHLLNQIYKNKHTTFLSCRWCVSIGVYCLFSVSVCLFSSLALYSIRSLSKLCSSWQISSIHSDTEGEISCYFKY